MIFVCDTCGVAKCQQCGRESKGSIPHSESCDGEHFNIEHKACDKCAADITVKSAAKICYNIELRDLFAIAALNGYITKQTINSELILPRIIESCYWVADLMIEQRNRKNG